MIFTVILDFQSYSALIQRGNYGLIILVMDGQGWFGVFLKPTSYILRQFHNDSEWGKKEITVSTVHEQSHENARMHLLPSHQSSKGNDW